MDNVRSNEPDVKGVVGKLTQGAADAGFVYRTDLVDGLKAITLPVRPAAGGRVRRRCREGGEAPRRRAPVPRRPDQRRVRRRAAEGGIRRRPMRAWFAIAIAAALAVALAFLTIPVIAIFVDRPPADVLASLGEPGALDALWLSLRTTAAALAIIVLVGTPGRVLPRHPPLPRPRARPSRWSSCRWCCRRRSRASRCWRRAPDVGGSLTFHIAASAAWWWRSRSSRRRSTCARARRRSRVDPSWLAASRTLGASEARTFARIAIPHRRARPRRGRRARRRPRARRVRRHADVRGLAPGRHADRSARHLRAVLERLRRRAGAVRRARRRVPRHPADGASSSGAGMLPIAAEAQLGGFSLDVELAVAAGASASRSPARRGRGRAACCASSPASCTRSAARVACGERVWLDTARGHRPAARRAPLRLRVPGLRAVPAPDRVAERRLRAARQAPRAAHARDRAARALRRRSPGRRAAARRCPAASASASRVARALAVEPAALLLDEPLSALDARTRAASGARARRRPARRRRPGAARHARFPGGGAARRPRRGDGRRADRPGRHARRPRGRARLAVRRPTSPARSCSPAPPRRPPTGSRA